MALVGLIASLLAVAGWSGIFKPEWTRDRRNTRDDVAAECRDRQAGDCTNHRRRQNRKSQRKLRPKAPSDHAEFNRLVELRAYTIWVGQGRPTGLAGEGVKEKNWLEAERQIENEVKARAFTIWVKQGRPAGAAGDAVREKNMRAAEAELLKETEDDLNRHPLD